MTVELINQLIILWTNVVLSWNTYNSRNWRL